MKATFWQSWKPTSIATPAGPIAVEKDNIVVVIVVPKWSEAFAALDQLLPKERTRGE